MFKIVDIKNIEKMGFVKVDVDYFYSAVVEEVRKTLFTVYAGSNYIRFSKTSYGVTEQLKCIYDWTKNGYIEWVDLDE